MVFGASWAAFASAQALGTWLGLGAQKLHCVCDCATRADPGLLQLLQSQLDRCGPEHLTRAWVETRPPPASSGVGLAGLCLAFALGVLVGALSLAAVPHVLRLFERCKTSGDLLEDARAPERPAGPRLLRHGPRSGALA